MVAETSADIHRTQGINKRRARHLTYAINISLAVGALMLGIKIYAYWLTSSVAILSDAAESVVHLFAISFAAYSVWLSHKPADKDHLYGHDRINFFSVGFEGCMIAVAAIFIFYEAAKRLWLGDLQLQEVEAGIGFIVLATVINAFLGYFLLRQGRRWNSIVLEANGRHVLADSLTSLGVIIGLLLTHYSGWLPFDPLAAMLVASHILWSGAILIRRSVGGLMDSADPEVDEVLRALLDSEASKYGVHYHFLRHRNTGNRLVIDFHLLFDNDITIAQAHDISILIERAIDERFELPTEVTSHFEPLHGHDEAHNVSSVSRD